MVAKRESSASVLKRLAGVVQRLSSEAHPDELLPEAVRLAKEVAGADMMSLMLADGQGGLAEHVVVGRKLAPMPGRARVGDATIAGGAALSRRSEIAAIHPTRKGHAAPKGARSVVAVPVVAGNELLGVILFGSRRPGFFGRHDLPLLEYLASQMAVGIHVGRLRDQAVRVRSRLELLHHLARLGNRHPRPEAFLSPVVDELQKLFGARYVATFQGDVEREVVVLLAQASSEPVDIVVGATQRIGAGLIGTCFKLGQTLYAKEVAREPVYIARIPGVQSELCVPIRMADASLGVLDVQCEAPAALDPDDVVVVETIAHALASVLARMARPVPA